MAEQIQSTECTHGTLDRKHEEMHKTTTMVILVLLCSRMLRRVKETSRNIYMFPHTYTHCILDGADSMMRQMHIDVDVPSTYSIKVAKFVMNGARTVTARQPHDELTSSERIDLVLIDILRDLEEHAVNTAVVTALRATSPYISDQEYDVITYSSSSMRKLMIMIMCAMPSEENTGFACSVAWERFKRTQIAAGHGDEMQQFLTTLKSCGFGEPEKDTDLMKAAH